MENGFCPKRRKIDDDECKVALTDLQESNEAVLPVPVGSGNCDVENLKNESEQSDDNSDSYISDCSAGESGWIGCQDSGPVKWIRSQMEKSVDPRSLLKEILPPDCSISQNVDDCILWKSLLDILMDPPKREKLQHVNTIEDTTELIQNSNHIMILTGAGVSVSCGIPDFRSKDGIYARLAQEYPNLPDPQAMFDIRYFKEDARPFFKFAKEIFPGQFKPSVSHQFIKLLEKKGKLLRNYTQNIDTLEQVAGIENIIHCHGSFKTATCMVCKTKVDHRDIEEDIMNQVIPQCKKCGSDDKSAILKPDIVFFGESLSEEFHNQLEEDKTVCDLLIVMGSSLKVRPVALIPNSLPENVPQILINREPLKHLHFDVELLGDCDIIVNELCHQLGEGWQSIYNGEPLVQVSRHDMVTPTFLTNDEQRNEIKEPSNDEDEQPDESKLKPNLNSPDLLNGRIRQNIKEDNDQRETLTNVSMVTAKGPPIMTDDDGGHDPQIECEAFLKKPENSSSNVKQNKNAEDNTDTYEGPSIELKSASFQLDIPTSKASQSYVEQRFVNLSQQLEDNTFLFIPPNRYIFEGADFLQDVDDVLDETTSESLLESDSQESLFTQDVQADCEAQAICVDSFDNKKE